MKGWVGMILVILYGILTIVSVVIALHKKKAIALAFPMVALFSYMAIKIIMVPLPLWETLQFIFGLR